MKTEFGTLGFIAAVVVFALWWTIPSSPRVAFELLEIEGVNLQADGTYETEAFQIHGDVAYLASDSLEGRGVGTRGERLAAEFVAARMQAIGLQPKGNDGWFHTYEFNPHPNLTVHGSGDSASLAMSTVQPIIGTNVAGYLDVGASRTLVIGAHHDHLGWGDENSLFAGDPAIHNGADDNASGVSAVLALAARLMKQRDALTTNVLFLTFSGEEKGLWGSKKWIQDPTIPLESIHYMLNMDMVGRLKEENVLAVYGNGTSPHWDVINGLESPFTFTFHESGVGPSDHTSFYLEGIPVLHFFTGQHSDYHKPSDDPEKLNYEGIEWVVSLLEDLILELNDVQDMEFTKTKDEDNESTPAFNVTLGVMPDYTFADAGMRIDGVTEGRPAANAGLQRDDVVVQMGDHAVIDMQTYMEGLGMFEPGETTPVTVLRNGEKVTVEVTWQ